MICYSHVKVIEARCLNQPTLHHRGKCRQAKSHESVFKYVKIAGNCICAYPTVLGDIIVVYYSSSYR